MTVLNDIGRTQIVASQGQTNLTIGFDITSSGNISAELASDQLRVVLWDGTTQIDLQFGINLDYVLSSDLQDVILNTPATAGYIYTILLDPPRTQGITYPQGSFSPLTQEAIADQNARMSISLDYRLRRVPSLMATFSGQLPFNPKDNAKKVIGISESEDSFTLFNVLDIFPPLSGGPGRIPEIDGDGWLGESPLLNNGTTVVSSVGMEMPTLKLGITQFFGNTVSSINFQLDGPGNYVGLERVDDQIFLIPRQGGAGGDITLEPGNIGYATYYGGENLLRVMPTLSFFLNKTSISDNLNDSTLTLYKDGSHPSILFQKFLTPNYVRHYFQIGTEKDHAVVLAFDPDEVVNGKFVQLLKDDVVLDGITYPRITLQASDEDPRGNIALSASTPNPETGQICVWEGHNADDTVKYMYAGELRIINNSLPTFERGGFRELSLRSSSFLFVNDGDAGASVTIDLRMGLVHYVLITSTNIIFNFLYDVPSPSAISFTLVLEKVSSMGVPINLVWPTSVLWPQGAPFNILKGVEDTVFEFHGTILNDASETQILLSPGMQEVILDTETVQSIATDVQENQLAKFVGVTGKFITNSKTPIIFNRSFLNWDFVNLTRRFHERVSLDVSIIGGNLEIDLDSAMVFNVDLTGGILDFNFLNLHDCSKQIRFTNSTDETITWPNYFYFSNGEPPILSGTSFVQFTIVTRPEVRIFVSLDIVNMQPI